MKYFFEDCLDFLTMVVLPFLVVMALLLGGVALIGPWADRSSCDSFGQQSGRTVKFVKYTPLSWACLTPASGGWIDVDNLRDVGK